LSTATEADFGEPALRVVGGVIVAIESFQASDRPG
jgi:hypothetical protein